MRTKKLFIGLLAGTLLMQTASIKTFAAEAERAGNIQTEATLVLNTEKAGTVTNDITSASPMSESLLTGTISVGNIIAEKLIASEEANSSDANGTKEEVAAKDTIIKETEKKTKVVKKDKAKSVKASKTKSVKKQSYSKSDLKYLACVIYTEAGNQSRKGKIAVGNVVLNRVKSNRYADSVYAVIHQPSQFGVVRNGSFRSAVAKYERGGFDSASEKACIEAAKAALEGENIVGKRLSFTRYSSSLARRHPSGVKIQDHYFY